MTNFEKIKQMTADELAHLIGKIADCCYDKADGNYLACEDCPLKNSNTCGEKGILEWLQQEAEE